MSAQTPAVIVGAGPAGLSAAIALANLNLEPLLIDEGDDVGGQIYRQPTVDLRPGPERRRTDTAAGQRLLNRFERVADRVHVLRGTTVWGIFDERRLFVSGGAVPEEIRADTLLLAPGAYEFVPPFPGWTLPGVMTPGAAQSMVKTMSVRPGRRALVAGTGPFLLVVAEQLAQAGIEVPAVVEAGSAGDLRRAVLGMLHAPGVLREGWRLTRQLGRRGIPVLRGHVVVEAGGDGAVAEAVVTPCDAAWRPQRDRARRFEVDTLCVGFGFVPRTQLAQLAGCRLRFVDEQGGWVPIVDDQQETTVPGVFTAGDGAGVAGALVAALEGALAGLGMAHRLGALSADALADRRRPLVRRLARLRRFRAGLDRLSRFRPGLLDLPRSDTIVCRCEDLSRAEIEEGLAAGGHTLRTLKPITRLGMGPCQGRMCWPFAARAVAAARECSVEEVGALSARPPIQPLTVGTLAEATR